MVKKFKPVAAAIGLGLALTTGAAVGQVVWGSGQTLFEDDDVDFLINDDGDGILEVGESLVAVFELNTANAVDIAPGELTGIAAITLVTITDVNNDGLDDLVFAPYDGGLNSLLPNDLTDDTGAAVAIYYDANPDLAVSAGNVVGGTLSCTTLDQCIAQATDGTLWEVDGFAGDPDEYWFALGAETDTNVVLVASTGSKFGDFNAGLSILYNGTGQNLALNSLDCSPLCNPGGDGFVDVIGSGTVNGGGCGGTAAAPGTAGLCQYPTLISDGAVATSDFDLIKAVQVPEPGTLALLATGILGLGMGLRRRQQ